MPITLEHFNQFKNTDGSFSMSLDDLKRVFSKQKKVMSGYFLWLNDNRAKIKETHFSDFNEYFKSYADIDDCDKLDYKNEYYKKKGLPESDKNSKPRIVSLVTTKAGIIWKTLEESEKKKYNDQSKSLKESRETDVDSNSNNSNDNNDNNDSDDSGEEMSVEEITYKGKKYYINTETNDIYDIDSSEKVAKKVGKKFVFIK